MRPLRPRRGGWVGHSNPQGVNKPRGHHVRSYLSAPAYGQKGKRASGSLLVTCGAPRKQGGRGLRGVRGKAGAFSVSSTGIRGQWGRATCATPRPRRGGWVGHSPLLSSLSSTDPANGHSRAQRAQGHSRASAASERSELPGSIDCLFIYLFLLSLCVRIHIRTRTPPNENWLSC